MRNVLLQAICVMAIICPIQQYGDGSGLCSAQYSNPNEECTCMIERNSTLQIGGNYIHVNIKPDGLARFSGNMGGVQGLYEYRPLNSFYGAVKAMWREGNTTAPGAARYLFDVDVHERFGYTMESYCEKFLLTLFTGFGYRYLGHKLTQDQTVLYLNHNEFYVPVGLLIDCDMSSYFSMGLNFMWMPQVNTTATLIPLNGAQWIINRKLANYLVEVPFNFFMDQFLISFKPFYEYWQDGASTAVTLTGVALGLPSNTYNFWGAELNVGYQF